jgi:uncharacterized phage protein gp47/JayE
MAGLTPTGLVIKSAETLKAEIEAQQRADIATDLDTSAEAVVGQLNGVMVPRIAELWELSLVLYNVRRPGDASADTLDGVCRITGTTRAEPRKGRVRLTLTVAANRTIAAGAVAQVAGQPDNRWVTLEDAVNDTAAPLDITVRAEAQSAGRHVANATTISVIATPVAGWTAVTNATDAAVGAELEKDPPLRIRREQELSGAATSPVDALRAAILRLKDADGNDLVASCTVDENESAFTDTIGRPPHAVEAVVEWIPGLSGADLDDARQLLAALIWKSKGGGIRTWGDPVAGHSASVLDSNGQTRVVRWTEPTLIDIYVRATLKRDATSYGGDASVQQAAVDYGATRRLGNAVVHSKLEGKLVAVAGVEDLVELLIGTSPTTLRAANLTIGPRERASIDTSRVTVVVL